MRINGFTHSFFLFWNEMNLRNPRATNRGTQLNAAHAQLLETLRPTAFAETCRLLTIQSLEFQEIWPKNSLETMRMIYHEKSEFWHREILVLQKTIYGELRKSPMSKFYKNSVDRRDFMLIRSGQTIRKIYWMNGFFLNNENHLLSLAFNRPRCHGNSTHLNQNARINSSLVNLYSCNKRAPNHK